MTAPEASVPSPTAAAQNGWPSAVSVSFSEQIQYIIDRDMIGQQHRLTSALSSGAPRLLETTSRLYCRRPVRS